MNTVTEIQPTTIPTAIPSRISPETIPSMNINIHGSFSIAADSQGFRIRGIPCDVQAFGCNRFKPAALTLAGLHDIADFFKNIGQS